MTTRILLDTGPLVAFLNRWDSNHEWAGSQFRQFTMPMFTCESVLVEACHLVRTLPGGSNAVMSLVQQDVIALSFALKDHVDTVAKLMAKYADVPISLADACLVRMSEVYDDCAIFTLDSHFRVYRRYGRGVIPTVMPPNR